MPRDSIYVYADLMQPKVMDILKKEPKGLTLIVRSKYRPLNMVQLTYVRRHWLGESKKKRM